jgi:hypothetical protein
LQGTVSGIYVIEITVADVSVIGRSSPTPAGLCAVLDAGGTPAGTAAPSDVSVQSLDGYHRRGGLAGASPHDLREPCFGFVTGENITYAINPCWQSTIGLTVPAGDCTSGVCYDYLRLEKQEK